MSQESRSNCGSSVSDCEIVMVRGVEDANGYPCVSVRVSTELTNVGCDWLLTLSSPGRWGESRRALHSCIG